MNWPFFCGNNEDAVAAGLLTHAVAKIPPLRAGIEPLTSDS